MRHGTALNLTLFLFLLASMLVCAAAVAGQAGATRLAIACVVSAGAACFNAVRLGFFVFERETHRNQAALRRQTYEALKAFEEATGKEFKFARRRQSVQRHRGAR